MNFDDVLMFTPRQLLAEEQKRPQQDGLAVASDLLYA